MSEKLYVRNMPVIHFILADGGKHSIDGEIGVSLMVLAKRHALSGILAECGGACCCATCHVHIDRRWVARLPSMAEDEQDVLEFAEGVNDTSRLSCQIKITDKLDDLIVYVPEKQF